MGKFILGAKPATPSNASVNWQEGFYEAATLTGVEPDLVAGNIVSGVQVLGVTGILVPGQNVPYELKDTGVTTIGVTGDDGTYQVNTPSYTVANGCVTDSRTGLMWPANPADATSYGDNPTTWTNAITACEGCTFAGYSDWRMPNARELATLFDFATGNPATYAYPTILLPDSPNPAVYWTSTSLGCADQFGHTGNAFAVDFAASYPQMTYYPYIQSDGPKVIPVRNA